MDIFDDRDEDAAEGTHGLDKPEVIWMINDDVKLPSGYALASSADQLLSLYARVFGADNPIPDLENINGYFETGNVILAVTKPYHGNHQQDFNATMVRSKNSLDFSLDLAPDPDFSDDDGEYQSIFLIAVPKDITDITASVRPPASATAAVSGDVEIDEYPATFTMRGPVEPTESPSDVDLAALPRPRWVN